MNSRFAKGKVPLERALSKLGIASRTQAAEWIRAGRLKVNGTIRKDPLFPVTPETAKFELDGKPLGQTEWKLLVLHKPRGVITTRADEKGRPTIFSLLPPDLQYVHAVGRLDWATSGLLLLTNDTRLSSWLTDPENGVIRTYLVSVRGRVEDDLPQRLEAGIQHEGDILQARKVLLRKASGKESHLTVELTEGKNREIRRMFESLGHPVTKLKRISYGGLELGDLALGSIRDVSQEEGLQAFPGAPIRNRSPE